MKAKLSDLRRWAEAHPPEYLDAMLKAGRVDGDWIEIPDEARARVVGKYPVTNKIIAPPRRPSLGETVDRLAAEKGKCYDANGNLIIGSPCWKNRTRQRRK